MRAVDVIEKKRDGHALSREEIIFFLTAYQHQEIPDYQVSAFLMAIFFQGMSDDELASFTQAMVASGQTLVLKDSSHFIIDKHSSGGVGDKTTIALAPIWASFDLFNLKLSGRGLGHTGGTIDKLESIPDFNFPSTEVELLQKLQETNIGVMSYSEELVPLDKKLYSLRDVTATVGSIPLIASSIMSKKLAISSDAILLDVKVGDGAFMKNREQADRLAQQMLTIGKSFNRKMVAVLTNMDQPLGSAVGNSLEVKEAIDIVKGQGPADAQELVNTLAGMGLKLSGQAQSLEEGIAMVEERVQTDLPLKQMKKFVACYGGDVKVVDNPDLLPRTSQTFNLLAQDIGEPEKNHLYLDSIVAEGVGRAAMVLGGGRTVKEDVIDPAVGILLKKKVGDPIVPDDVIAEIHYQKEADLSEAKKFYWVVLSFLKKR